MSIWYLKTVIPAASVGMPQVRSHGGPWERGHLHPSSFILHPSFLVLAEPDRICLAMLSKGSVVVLPVLLLGIIWWLRPVDNPGHSLTAPFFAVAAALAAVNVWFQTHGSGEVLRTASFTERLLGRRSGVVLPSKGALAARSVFRISAVAYQVGNPMWWLPLLAALAVTALLWLRIGQVGAGRFCLPGDFSAWL